MASGMIPVRLLEPRRSSLTVCLKRVSGRGPVRRLLACCVNLQLLWEAAIGRLDTPGQIHDLNFLQWCKSSPWDTSIEIVAAKLHNLYAWKTCYEPWGDFPLQFIPPQAKDGQIGCIGDIPLGIWQLPGKTTSKPVA
ncbi:hypothetical protein M427DRAFT_440251 [Gonapodya prolifera JEL478]|uniref:Uncharacterized protein n=1 Tax=Gonapodya prolifera (strain JEL478) TaxID=1344416 RepID=A0A139A384_GONPJ|nr:hypothetical protein M427DRAFT_440251 [Gonapodya prolifera JEL478]|eukprot:KXS11252.1 hypothetical protein M427DRAFT_440251 [Gonapodya prolifera JEL478]